jgi:hypothetical protein
VRNQEKALARTCFVVRPFGKKTFRAKKASADNDAPSAYEDIEVNFDEIHEALIVPAMERAGLVGGTTASHKEAECQCLLRAWCPARIARQANGDDPIQG